MGVLNQTIIIIFVGLSFCNGLNQTLKCVAKVLPCANLGYDCSRPDSVFFLKIRGSGGKMFGEGVLNHIFEREQMVIAEGWSLSHTPTLTKLQNLEGRGDTIRITILRDPIERALSRYWFEGRWQLFAKERSEESAMPFHLWLTKDMCGPSKDRSGRLWNCMKNYYVKTFSGWSGNSMCEGEQNNDQCQEGVSGAQLIASQHILSSRFDVVLISEWLSSKAQIKLLAKLLCFEIDSNGDLPIRSLSTPGAQLREVPSFKSKRPAGGHSKERHFEWNPDPSDFEYLISVNKFDIDLFEWAKETMRNRLSKLPYIQPHDMQSILQTTQTNP